MTSERPLYKLDVGGIVYLVDPATQTAYTYDPTNPLEVGRIEWPTLHEAPRIVFHDGYRAKLEQRLAAWVAAQNAPPNTSTTAS